MRGPVSVGISRPHVQLSQATVMVGGLLAMWILWLAAQNKLITYWQILMGQGGAQATTTGSGTVGGATSGNITSMTGTPGASATATVTPTSGLLTSYATPVTSTVGDLATGGGFLSGLF